MIRLFRSGVLLGAGALIAKLLVTGQMRYYLSPSLDGVIAATGLVLAGMGTAELWRSVRLGRAPQHDAHTGLDAAVALGLTAIPLVVGLVLSPRALGTESLGGASVSRLVLAYETSSDVPSSPAPASSTAPAAPAPSTASAPRRAIADVPDLIAYVRQAGPSGAGQPVRALGLLTHSDALPANQFVLVRYAIVHCVADAQPIGVLVVAPDAVNLRGDQWVEVSGALSSEPRGADRLVGIQATRITPADEPSEPYIQWS